MNKPYASEFREREWRSLTKRDGFDPHPDLGYKIFVRQEQIKKEKRSKTIDRIGKWVAGASLCLITAIAGAGVYNLQDYVKTQRKLSDLGYTEVTDGVARNTLRDLEKSDTLLNTIFTLGRHHGCEHMLYLTSQSPFWQTDIQAGKDWAAQHPNASLQNSDFMKKEYEKLAKEARNY